MMRDMKKLMFMHTFIPIYHVPFLTLLMSAYEHLSVKNLLMFSLNEDYDLHPFQYNISMLDLPNLDDVNVINAYNKCFAQ